MQIKATAGACDHVILREDGGDRARQELRDFPLGELCRLGLPDLQTRIDAAIAEVRRLRRTEAGGK